MSITVFRSPIQIRDYVSEETIHDEMIPEAAALGGVALAATFLSMGGDPTVLAIPGAMLAAVVALLKATQEKRQWTDKGIVVIGTSIVGATLPSAAAHLMWPQWLEKLTWHVFLLAGFLFGIVGWMLVWPVILALDSRREKIAKVAIAQFSRKYGLPVDPESEAGQQVPKN